MNKHAKRVRDKARVSYSTALRLVTGQLAFKPRVDSCLIKAALTGLPQAREPDSSSALCRCSACVGPIIDPTFALKALAYNKADKL